MQASAEILIIGAGPAGLAAASYCAQRRKSFVIVETGQRIKLRNHGDTNRLAQGVGDSGLYSDGKFSFYPSATKLWQLPDKKSLTEGYGWLCGHLSDFGMVVPEFPLVLRDDCLSPAGNGEADIKSKKYPSFYLSLSQRVQLGEKLECKCRNSLILDSSVIKIEYLGKTQLFNCYLSSTPSAENEMIKCKAIIFAGGRFGPISLFSMLPEIPRQFLRLEFGLRIQQPTSEFFLNSNRQTDPKLILKENNGLEYRTFCCCRNGEVVTILTGEIKTVSGRGDCEVSGLSNVGFNLRIENEAHGTAVWENILKSLRSNLSWLPVEEPWESFVDMENSRARSSSAITKFFGPEIANYLAQGLLQFQQSLSIKGQSATLVAPAVEAVAFYPKIDNNLRVSPYPLWIAGDSTGIFRGLTASFVSGYYAASQAVRFAETING